MLIETHCHLDYLKQDSTEVLLEKSREQGIEKIITIAVSPENFDAVENLTKSHEMVFGTLGVHPHDAIKCRAEHLDDLRTRIPLNSKILAVGEIGLDYHYDNSPRHIQRDVFEKHLQLAIDLNLPVVIHSRDAEDDTIAILKNFESTLNKDRPGVIHSFTATQELADAALDLGFFLGFNGIITFKKAHDVRDVLANCPIDRILFETDAPFLTPAPNRGKENAPHFLPWIAEKCAEIKELEKDQLSAQVYENSLKLFQF
jgi:TatD DNase family protein